MSYSIRTENIDRLADYLDALVDAEADAVVFDVENSSRFAYKLREAFFAAQQYPEYSQYHGLREEYKVLAGIRQVTCKRIIRDGKPVRAAPVNVQKVQLTEVTGLTRVIGAALKFKAAQELWFPNANLSHDSKVKLHNWTAARDWQYIDHVRAGLTLTKNEIDLDLIWSPEDE